MLRYFELSWAGFILTAWMALLPQCKTQKSSGGGSAPTEGSSAGQDQKSDSPESPASTATVPMGSASLPIGSDEAVQIPQPGEKVSDLPTAPGTKVAAGTLTSQVWTAAGSPYRVQGDILLPEGASLTVEAGVTIIFEGAYKWTVLGGKLAFKGTETQAIRLTATLRDPGWYGILFCPDPSCTQEATKGELDATYTIFEYARANDSEGSFRYWRRGGALMLLNTARVHIANSTFRYNYASEVGGALELLAISNEKTAQLDNLRFFANEAGSGGALRLSHINARRWTGLTFIANRVRAYPDSYGGAIESEDANQITLIKVLARGNTAESTERDQGLGGAFYCYSPGLTLVDPVELKDNKPETSIGCGTDLP